MFILTGGAGFIGSDFLGKLNLEGISDILIVDNLNPLKEKNLKNKKYTDYIHKNDFLKKLNNFSKIDGIIHMGACSSTTETNESYMMQNNLEYTKELASFALAKNIRFIYASSAATYGDGDLGFSDQNFDKLKPLNLYARSKHLFDQWAISTGAVNNIVGLKFFNVYGPGEFHKGDMRSVVLKSFEQIKKTGKVSLFKSYHPEYKDGEQKRDFIYVKDCSNVMWWLLNNQVNGIYNLGTGNARTWKDLVSSVFKSLEQEANIDFIEMPESLKAKYQYFTQAEMAKLKAAGWKNEFISIEAGVADYVKSTLLCE
jgi:ADP-L-glycero-D-manno-heptose 6-epimerase